MSKSTNQSAAVLSSSPSYLQESKEILASAFKRIVRSSLEIIEAGNRLLRLKNDTAHGQWASVVESLGVSLSFAERAMRISGRFSGLHNLAVAVVHCSKLTELECLDDEELRALDAGATVRGISLETIGDLKVKELRAALRGGDRGGKSSGKPSNNSPILGSVKGALTHLLQPGNDQESNVATSRDRKSVV